MKLLSSPLVITIVVLITLLLTLSIVLSHKHKENIKLRKEVVSLEELSLRQRGVISELEQEIKDRPKEYIETTRDVYTELCRGEILGESILTLLPMTVTTKPAKDIGAKNEKDVYVDIDGKLPPSLILQLQ